MSASPRPRILLLAPYYDRAVPGESWSTYQWVRGISESLPTTVLTSHHPGWNAGDSPTSAARTVNWDEPRLPGARGRLAWEMKPGYPWFYRRARRWIKAALRRGETFDLVHQINPLALRYPSPARGLGLPYLIGPLAGSLPTPPGFREEIRERAWFRRLRGLDRLRIRHDPWLRSTYSGAAAILGVAPYVREFLAPCRPRRFELMAETGVEEVADEPLPARRPDEPLRLLFVGRVIRTKGILDGIRAVARVVPRIDVRLDVLGTGDLLEECRAEAARLGITERVCFHGRVDHATVFAWYRRAHAFLFPSFREPSGNVVFEAMSRGLPLITCDAGGPGHVVDESCGYRVPPADPDSYAAALAERITTAYENPAELARLSAGALRRMREVALWPNKIRTLLDLYAELGGPGRGSGAAASDETPLRKHAGATP